MRIRWFNGGVPVSRRMRLKLLDSYTFGEPADLTEIDICRQNQFMTLCQIMMDLMIYAYMYWSFR